MSSPEISAGILPISVVGEVSPDVRLQAITLVANILSFKMASCNKYYRVEGIIVYVSDHKFAAPVLQQFQSAGIGNLVKRCIVKNTGAHWHLHTSADIHMVLDNVLFRARL